MQPHGFHDGQCMKLPAYLQSRAVKSSIAVCYTVVFENLEFYVPTVLGDIRRQGIIVTSAAFLSGVLEGGDTWLAIWLVALFGYSAGNCIDGHAGFKAAVFSIQPLRDNTSTASST